MKSNYDDLDGFLTISLFAFVEVARQQGDWPDSEEVRKLAYERYENESNSQ